MRLISALAMMSLGLSAVNADQPVQIQQVPQCWASTGVAEYADTDSLAACSLPDGRTLVFASEKKANRVDVFDALTGKLIAVIGKPGAGVGEFAYPNGVIVASFAVGKGEQGSEKTRAAVLIVERDNARVQAFWADTLKPAGVFGMGKLNKPYGGAISYRDGAVYLYVTDTECAPERTVSVFRLTCDGERVAGEFVRSFGDASGPGQIHEAESIAVDDKLGRVLLCDEDETQADVKVYTTEGSFTGVTFGKGDIRREPEGVVVLDQPGAGVVILTDQRQEISVWNVYDRKTYQRITVFTGDPLISNTDGICVHAGPVGQHKRGLFLAVNNDLDVRAYPLDTILTTIEAAK